LVVASVKENRMTSETFRAPRARPTLLALLLGWGIALAPAPAQVSTASIAVGTSAVALEPCFLKGVQTRARCGTLPVREDRVAKQGRELDLQIAVLPALEDPPQPDPLFILAGGGHMLSRERIIFGHTD
jgi:hypothetical protein